MAECCSEPKQSSCPSVGANARARGGEAVLLPETYDRRVLPRARLGLLGVPRGRTLWPLPGCRHRRPFVPLGMAGLPRDIWALPPLPPLQPPVCSLHSLLWAYLDSKEEVLQTAKGSPGHALPTLAWSHLQAWGQCSELALTQFPWTTPFNHLNSQEFGCHSEEHTCLQKIPSSPAVLQLKATLCSPLSP